MTAAKYDHMLKQVKDKDNQFERNQIIKWAAPKGHVGEYKTLRAKVIEEQGFDRVIDYLVVSELLSMYVRAKPQDTRGDLWIYSYNESNVHAKLVSQDIFKPQMKQLA